MNASETWLNPSRVSHELDSTMLAANASWLGVDMYLVPWRYNHNGKSGEFQRVLDSMVGLART